MSYKEKDKIRGETGMITRRSLLTSFMSTASVVVAQAFGIPSFPVDTHIHRCAQRWGLTSGKNVVTTERDLKKFFPIEEWNKLHIQIIMYARNYCSARSCFGLECPICTSCYPKRKSKFIHKKP